MRGAYEINISPRPQPGTGQFSRGQSTNLPVKSRHMAPNMQVIIMMNTEMTNLCMADMPRKRPGLRRRRLVGGLSNGNSLGSSNWLVDASSRRPSNMCTSCWGVYHSPGRRCISPNCTVTVLSFVRRRRLPSGSRPMMRPINGDLFSAKRRIVFSLNAR